MRVQRMAEGSRAHDKHLSPPRPRHVWYAGVPPRASTTSVLATRLWGNLNVPIQPLLRELPEHIPEHLGVHNVLLALLPLQQGELALRLLILRVQFKNLRWTRGMLGNGGGGRDERSSEEVCGECSRLEAELGSAHRSRLADIGVQPPGAGFVAASRSFRFPTPGRLTRGRAPS